MAVDRGAVDRALVPVENSLEGGVTATLDALAWDAHETVILGETVLAIRNCLIAREPIALDAIEAVISHPQPLAQCARFLRTELPGAACARPPRPPTPCAPSRSAASRGPRWARTAPPSATAAACCARRVDDEPGNTTRFVWLGRAGSAPLPADGAGAWKTSVVFAGAGDAAARAGWCAACRSSPSAA